MDSLIETFHIDWKLMVAQAINFAVVLLVLWRFALRPLKKLMDERAKTIQGGLDNAEKQKELLAAQEAEYEKRLNEARTEAANLMKEVKKDAETKRNELVEKAQLEVTTMIAVGKKQLEADKQQMLTDAKKEIVAVVLAATEKVLGETVPGKVETHLVEEGIKGI